MSTTTTWSDEAITAKIREIAKTTFGLDLPDSGLPIKDSGLDSLALIDALFDYCMGTCQDGNPSGLLMDEAITSGDLADEFAEALAQDLVDDDLLGGTSPDDK